MGFHREGLTDPLPSTVEENIQVAVQVGNLAAEVELIREDQVRRDSRMPPPSVQPPGVEEKPPSTFLIYRDGHQLKVRNYAIVGKTLWVFSDQSTR
jgi:hypothetical protein